MVALHEKRVRKCLSKVKGEQTKPKPIRPDYHGPSIHVSICFHYCRSVVDPILLLFYQLPKPGLSFLFLWFSVDCSSVSDAAASSARGGRNDDRDAGIERVEVEASLQKVVVTGCVNRSKILKALRRVGLRAEPWAPHNELLSAYATTSLMFNNSYSFF